MLIVTVRFSDVVQPAQGGGWRMPIGPKTSGSAELHVINLYQIWHICNIYFVNIFPIGNPCEGGGTRGSNAGSCV